MAPDTQLAERPSSPPSPAESQWSGGRTVIDAARESHFIDFAELWRYRELLWMLALRDLKVRYRQALVGAAWAVIQPVTAMAIFAVLFNLLGRKPVSGDVPYLVVAYCGLVPWQLFATSLSQSSGSLVNNRQVITKVYFPRMLLPAASILCALVDFAIALVVLVGLVCWYGIVPGPAIAAFPVFVLMAVVASLAAGLWLSALNALYRDVMYVVPFLIQVGFFVTPVVYETGAIIPARWQWVYALNPLVGALEGMRWSVLGTAAPAAGVLLVSLASAIVLLAGGAVFFRRVEHTIADRI